VEGGKIDEVWAGLVPLPERFGSVAGGKRASGGRAPRRTRSCCENRIGEELRL